MKTTRFVVCIDIPEESLSVAYAKLKLFMDQGNTVRMRVNEFAEYKDNMVGWETSDEAYGTDGKVIDPSDLQKTIEAYPLPEDIRNTVVSLLVQQKYILAIKTYREITYAGLRDSKTYVDDVRKSLTTEECLSNPFWCNGNPAE